MKRIAAITLYAAATLSAYTQANAASRPVASSDAIKKLLIKDEIRDTLAVYNQLVDRDDGAPTRQMWADRMFTDDADMLAFYPDGKPDIEFHGHAAILKAFGGGDGKETGLASKHYLTSVTFDEVSENHVKTHINALSITTTKNIVDQHCAGCGGHPVSISMFVYENDWVKSNGEWRIRKMIVRFKN